MGNKYGGTQSVPGGAAIVTSHLFLQTSIAVIWDFDKTLIPGYMQDPIFNHYQVNARKFWDEVNALPDYHREHGIKHVNEDSIYLNHMLTYVREGVFKGLTNVMLKQLGAHLKFYPGLPDFFERTRRLVHDSAKYQRHDIRLEHYVVSTGLRQMILGSAIADHIDGVWACEFAEETPGPGYLEAEHPQMFDQEPAICDIAYALDNTTKTRAAFEINKGVNVSPEISVNSKIPENERRVPFNNMIYIADGPSDVPVFSVVKQFGGNAFAVYKKGSKNEFNQVNKLLQQNRVDAFGEADYKAGSQTSMWIENTIEEIAERIVRDREAALSERIGRPPRHLQDRDDKKSNEPIVEQLNLGE